MQELPVLIVWELSSRAGGHVAKVEQEWISKCHTNSSSEWTPGDGEGQGREVWHAAVHGVANSHTPLGDWTTTSRNRNGPGVFKKFLLTVALGYRTWHRYGQTAWLLTYHLRKFVLWSIKSKTHTHILTHSKSLNFIHDPVPLFLSTPQLQLLWLTMEGIQPSCPLEKKSLLWLSWEAPPNKVSELSIVWGYVFQWTLN